MVKITVSEGQYIASDLFQWDLNQVLEIAGLTIDFEPEIHFASAFNNEVIVQKGEVVENGVIRVRIPNILLQKAYSIVIVVCKADEDSFKSHYMYELPVQARPKPTNYVSEDDEEDIYSFSVLKSEIEKLYKRIDTIDSDPKKYVILEDSETGQSYRVYVENGKLKMEVVE